MINKPTVLLNDADILLPFPNLLSSPERIIQSVDQKSSGSFRYSSHHFRSYRPNRTLYLGNPSARDKEYIR